VFCKRITSIPFFMLSILYCIMGLCLMNMVSPISSAESATLIIGSSGCKAGDIISIPLTLKTGGEKISSLGADIHVDSSLFQITGAVIGTASTAAGKTILSNSFDHDTYRIRVIASNNINSIDDGIVAYLTVKVNDFISPMVLSLAAESISGSDAVGRYVDISTISYIILGDNSPGCLIPSGSYIKVFGSAGVNSVNLQSGGRVECTNFPGDNTINIQESADEFTVKRLGAMVYLQNATSGTMLKIPATKTPQTLTFTNGSFILVITDSRIQLGIKEVTTAEIPVRI